MSKLLTFLFLLATSFSFAQGGWTTLNIHTSGRYDDLYFVDGHNGWAAGGPSGRVYKTTDGGETWTYTGINPDSTIKGKYLRSIEFMDANIGLCGSLDTSLYRTTDGGATWSDVSGDISPKPAGVCGLAKADSVTIYGVGIWSSPAFVIKSTDKGLHWTFIDMSLYAISLVDVFFFDADHGFVTGAKSDKAGGVILYTSDGGKTWVEKITTKAENERVWKIQSPDNKHFFASIEAFSGKTRYLKSNDRGQTWIIGTVSTDNFYIQAIGFIDSLRGWTGGNNALFETKNGGLGWRQVQVGSTYDRFVKVNEATAYLTGAKVYKFSRDAVITGVDPEPYDPIHKISIAPNPTGGKATIHITFGISTVAKVYLYSADGRNPNKIFEGGVEAGAKTIPIDISDLPAQVLTVILKTNEGMVSAKLVKK